MATGDRRRLSYREASEFLERRYGVAYGYPALGRMIHVLWWMTVGKRRFVADDPSTHVIRAEKKRARRSVGAPGGGSADPEAAATREGVTYRPARTVR